MKAPTVAAEAAAPEATTAKAAAPEATTAKAAAPEAAAAKTVVSRDLPAGQEKREQRGERHEPDVADHRGLLVSLGVGGVAGCAEDGDWGGGGTRTMTKL